MVDFDTLVAGVLRRSVPGFEQLVRVARLSGGASQETYELTAVVAGGTSRFAMRRAVGGMLEKPADSRPGLEAEALLMTVAGRAGVPEPKVVCVLEVDDGLGLGFVMEWLEGETLGSRILRSPELATVRPRLAYECGQVLARIHGIDPVESGLTEHLTSVSTHEFITATWERYQSFDTPQPMIDYTAKWLLGHIPPEGPAKVVHNDFRNGNLMVGPEGIVAVLDWEVAHLGDPIRDLGWICTNSWRFGRRERTVGGFGDLEDLLAGYRAESGVEVDPDHVHFWEVFGSFWWAVGCLGMADQWREGPDRTVERPGIARRSSECQVDCVNSLISGPVELVEPSSPQSSVGMPSADELLVSVRDFLKVDVRSAVTGRENFLALVAANSVDIVRRELSLGPGHTRGEASRLRDIFGDDGTLEDLRWRLCNGLRDGSIALDRDDVIDHLRTTVVNQVAIDQPSYSGFLAATS